MSETFTRYGSHGRVAGNSYTKYFGVLFWRDARKMMKIRPL